MHQYCFFSFPKHYHLLCSSHHWFRGHKCWLENNTSKKYIYFFFPEWAWWMTWLKIISIELFKLKVFALSCSTHLFIQSLLISCDMPGLLICKQIWMQYISSLQWGTLQKYTWPFFLYSLLSTFLCSVSVLGWDRKCLESECVYTKRSLNDPLTSSPTTIKNCY